MKRDYEVGLVVRLDPSDEVINESITQVQGWIGSIAQGSVSGMDRWGRRKLAYEVDNQREGYYVFLKANMESTALPELERTLNLATAILRYLIVQPD